MIKLPVILGELTLGWEHCIDESVLIRQGLEEKAAQEPDYIRPIVLIQAQPKNQHPQPDEVKEYLITNHHIDATQIAIATGTQKDLENVDLFNNQCPIRFVITVGSAQRRLGLLFRLRALWTTKHSILKRY